MISFFGRKKKEKVKVSKKQRHKDKVDLSEWKLQESDRQARLSKLRRSGEHRMNGKHKRKRSQEHKNLIQEKRRRRRDGEEEQQRDVEAKKEKRKEKKTHTHKTWIHAPIGLDVRGYQVTASLKAEKERERRKKGVEQAETG